MNNFTVCRTGSTCTFRYLGREVPVTFFVFSGKYSKLKILVQLKKFSKSIKLYCASTYVLCLYSFTTLNCSHPLQEHKVKIK